MLDCRGVSASYGRHQAIDDVAIRVAPGEIVVILGANGAGKTTLLNAIAGLVPASGEVTLEGRSLREVLFCCFSEDDRRRYEALLEP